MNPRVILDVLGGAISTYEVVDGEVIVARIVIHSGINLARPDRIATDGSGTARKIARSVHEAACDEARAIAKTEAYAVSCRERKKVEMLFAHLKRILRLDRLRLRGPSGAKDELPHVARMGASASAG